jgi:WD40 repeat protein
LATASRDRTIRLWTIPEGRPIKTLVDHRDWVTHMAINPAGTHMASCSADGMIKVWDLETLECTGTAFGLGRFLCLAMSADTICAGDSTGNFWTLLYGVRREPQSRAPRS